MMDCTHYRAALLADPHDNRAELLLHLETCDQCSRYTGQLLLFEGRLERALRLDVPGPAAAAPAVVSLSAAAAARTARRRVGRGWLAAAASVVLALAVAGGLWLAAPGPSLAAAVVGHMSEEPEAWVRTDIPVPRPTLDRVLAASHLGLKGNAGLVSYANSCLFRGHLVPHLVVQTDSGPVTVMVLTHEAARAAQRFDEQGYRGMIVPVPGHGSIAVLERGPATGMAAVQRVADQVRQAIDWRA